MKNDLCISCKSKKLTSVLNLGNHAWCNNFLDELEVGTENKYPLHLIFCENCELLQLDYFVPKEIMFKNHTYVSSTTKTLKKHFLELAEENKTQFNLTSEDIIVDIGGNDGTQLKQYISIGLPNVYNIESADNIAEIAINDGVRTINDYFNEKLIKNNFKEGSIKLINASGVFFHLEEIHSVIKGIKYGLSDEGVLVVQFMYAGTMIEKLNFDGIYHEHLCYYTLKSLDNLLRPYGLEIFDAYYSEIHSGSMMTKIGHIEHGWKKTKRYEESKKIDDRYDFNGFIQFSDRIKENRDNLKNVIIKLKKDNPNIKIYAYGAPAKGNTLLTYFGIDNSMIDKCVEVNKLKIGKYLPVSHIPIIKENDNDIPDYYLLLSHNFADEIIGRYEGKKIKFIIPFPEVKIFES